VYKERHRNELPLILSALAPYKSEFKALAVESTFNWYWLVDGLMDAGYPVHLANPAARTGHPQGDTHGTTVRCPWRGASI
jgi:transposase